MSEQSKEARIIMAIEALRSNPKLHVFKAAKTYDVPRTTLCERMNGTTFKSEIRPQNRLLNALEENVLLKCIIELDDRGFSPKVEVVEDMANHILASHKLQCVGKL